MRIRTLGLAALGGVFCIEGYSGFPLEIGLGFPRAFFRRDVRFGSLAHILTSRAMSALPPKADIRQRALDVRHVPEPDMR